MGVERYDSGKVQCVRNKVSVVVTICFVNRTFSALSQQPLEKLEKKKDKEAGHQYLFIHIPFPLTSGAWTTDITRMEWDNVIAG